MLIVNAFRMATARQKQAARSNIRKAQAARRGNTRSRRSRTDTDDENKNK